MAPDCWRLPPLLLSDGEQRDLRVADGVFTAHSIDGAESLPGRFALPGFVDAHAHVALGPEKQPLDLAAATDALRGRRDEGVLAVRDVGAPGSVTLRITADPSLPRLQAAGRWFAPVGRFYPSFHEPVPAEHLVDAARTEIAAGARWIKVIADWMPGELDYERDLLTQLVAAAHAAGARVAAHSAEARVKEVVASGVDSVEHGWLLDASGVTILAGTDTAGSIGDEIRHLIDFGLSPTQALRAASTSARDFLGLPSLEAGAPADVVTFEADPREDPVVLATPASVVLGGMRVR